MVSSLSFLSCAMQVDIALIAEEMEMDKDAAERALREHKGDAVATLQTLVAA